ncbi:hypothetical protein DNL40_10890 [Xylanimonas oleitrophica]|uniref:Uncharacterized protein n=1 Tax=Xylanimonas oleitrophica TaxID=2607479 RepID=A0A2W5Y3Z2_9MICO|nr:hypothetical protein [Xylanimonas oleitrophica]PZR52614.1 hypothetical protein DNL40_10890 [Xylanimonas oleitrophica]
MEERHTSGHRPWDELVARFTRTPGVVGEVEDPLTWGLDLEEETVTGDGQEDDPTSGRFLRAYRSFAGEALEVETLHAPCPPETVEDVVRAAASGALAAPLHADLRAPVEAPSDAPDEGPDTPDFAEAYQDYRSAMRAIVETVDEVPLTEGTFVVDAAPVPCVRVQARGVVALYAEVSGRALVVTGPADLVDRAGVVMRPVRSILQGEGPRD